MDVAHSLTAPGERAEKEIDSFITRRAAQGDKEAEAELWRRSVASYHDARRRQNRAAWFAYFCQQADAHRKLSENYEARAEALCSEDRGEGGR